MAARLVRPATAATAATATAGTTTATLKGQVWLGHPLQAHFPARTISYKDFFGRRTFFPFFPYLFLKHLSGRRVLPQHGRSRRLSGHPVQGEGDGAAVGPIWAEVLLDRGQDGLPQVQLHVALGGHKVHRGQHRSVVSHRRVS